MVNSDLGPIRKLMTQKKVCPLAEPDGADYRIQVGRGFFGEYTKMAKASHPIFAGIKVSRRYTFRGVRIEMIESFEAMEWRIRKEKDCVITQWTEADI